MRLADGLSLPARFEVERILGTGSFGSVYLVYDRERGERVALKHLRHASPSALFRFKRELRSLADLRHPNLLRLYELFSEDGWFLTMEAVRGEPITSLGPERVGPAFAQLAQALEALHAAGHVHRDLKPSNVLVEASGRVVLLDFGLIGELEATHSVEVVGTPRYASPEQLAGEPAGEAADWYAFGAMLFEALSGRPPFEGRAFEVMMQKQRVPAPPLGQAAPGAPAALAELVDGLLAREPAARPDVVAVRAALEGHAPATLDGEPTFVGREDELAELERAFTSGGSAFVWIEGQSGVGKSALLAALTARLAKGAYVLRGRCFQQQSVPHAALDGVIDDLTHRLMATPAEERARLVQREMAHASLLFPVLGRVPELAGAGMPLADAPRRREAAVRALRALLASLGRQRPVAMVIDDLQWADADSALLLREVLGGGGAPALFVVGASRPIDRPRHPFFAALKDTPADVQVLAPLAEERTRALARRLIPGAGEATVDAVARESEGLPFLIEELARQARRDGGRALSAAEVVRARFARLGPEERAWLEPIALARRPLALASLALILGEGGVDVVDRLRRDRWIQVHDGEGGPSVEPYHDRLAEAVLSALAPERAVALHAAIAAALRAREGAEPETVAFHLERAGEDDEARRYVVEAGRHAMRALAWDRAVRLFSRGLERAGDAREARALRIALGDALAGAGRGREAAEVYRVACRGAEHELVLELERRVADQLLRAGHVEDGYRAFDAVLAAVGERAASGKAAIASLLWHRTRLKLRGLGFEERAEAACAPAALRRIDVLWSAGVGSSLLDSARGADFLARSLLAALEVGEPRRVARSLAYEACFVSNRGRAAIASARARIDDSRRIAERLDDDYLRALTLGATCVVEFNAGRWSRAVEAAERSERVFERQAVGFQREVSSVRFFRMVANVMLGDLRAVAGRRSELLRVAEERGDRFAATNYRSGLPNLLHLAADDLAGARAEAEEAIDAWPVEGFHLQHFFDLYARVAHEIYAGEGEHAAALVRTRWRAYERSLLGRLEFIRITAEDLHARATLAAMAAGRWQRGARRRSVLARVAALRAERVLWADASASMLEGTLARLEGREEAVSHFADAAAQYAQAEMTIHALVARRASLASAGRSTAEPDAALEARGVVAPARYERLLVPA